MATTQIAIRLDDELLERIDRIRPILGKMRMSRSDVIRALLVDAVTKSEKRVASPRRLRKSVVPRGTPTTTRSSP